MTKYALPQGHGFGPRLAALRKAAGFTQRQLAEELGISRRCIAYCASESDHPPANLLADSLAHLNASTENLLSDAPPGRPPRLSPRLERWLKQVERLRPNSSSNC